MGRKRAVSDAFPPDRKTPAQATLGGGFGFKGGRSAVTFFSSPPDLIRGSMPVPDNSWMAGPSPRLSGLILAIDLRYAQKQVFQL